MKGGTIPGCFEGPIPGNGPVAGLLPNPGSGAADGLLPSPGSGAADGLLPNPGNGTFEGLPPNPGSGAGSLPPGDPPSFPFRNLLNLVLHTLMLVAVRKNDLKEYF